jgi:hypothetical protein
MFQPRMSSLAAIVIGLAISGASATPLAGQAHSPAAAAPDIGTLNLRLTERRAPRTDGRWRLRELSEPVAEEGRSLVHWGWKKVTLRLPLGNLR